MTCSYCDYPILESQATYETENDGIVHLDCFDAHRTPREKKVQKMHPIEVQLGLCPNCGARKVIGSGVCLQCGRGPRIG